MLNFYVLFAVYLLFIVDITLCGKTCLLKVRCKFHKFASNLGISIRNTPSSTDAETKYFARLTSYPVRGWTGKNKAFCSPGTQNGRCVIKVYCQSKDEL